LLGGPFILAAMYIKHNTFNSFLPEQPEQTGAILYFNQAIDGCTMCKSLNFLHLNAFSAGKPTTSKH